MSALRFKREEERAITAAYQEKHATPFAKPGGRLFVFIEISNRFAVDFQNDVAAPYARLISRTPWLHSSDNDPLRSLQPEAFRHLRRKPLNGETQFTFLRRGRDDLFVF